MKYRLYQMRLHSDDAQLLAFLHQRIPERWESLGDMREAGRAIELLFPGVKAEYISIQRPQRQQAQRLSRL